MRTPRRLLLPALLVGAMLLASAGGVAAIATKGHGHGHGGKPGHGNGGGKPGNGNGNGGGAPQGGPNPPGKPNVVLIVSDDQSYEQTKVMRWLNGRKDWIRFTNTYYQNSLCCPSRATILSGQYDIHTGVDTLNGEDFRDQASLATWFKASNYRTSLVGKYLNGYPFGRGTNYTPPGWDDWHAFTGERIENRTGYYYNYRLSENGKDRRFGTKPADYSTDVLADRAVDFIRRSASRTPFFLYFTPYASHSPRIPAKRHETMFAGKKMPRSRAFNESNVGKPPFWSQLPPQPPNEMDRRRRDAWRTSQAADEAVARIFKVLKKTGELDETIVIFVTDNAYAFGEHRWSGKTCQYDPCNRSTMFVRVPGLPGKTVDTPVSNADINETLVELTGLSRTIPSDGQSLVPLLRGSEADWLANGWRGGILLHNSSGVEDDETQPVGGAKPGFWGIRSLRYKYVEALTPGPSQRCVAPAPTTGTFCELYDLASDPNELRNLAGRPEYAAILADHANRLRALRGF